MFKFLKDKLKAAVSSLSNKVEEEPPKASEAADEPKEEKKGFFQRIKEGVIGQSEETPEVSKEEAPVEDTPLSRLNKAAKESRQKKKQQEESLDADKIEQIIRDVDLHAPVSIETEPEPVPEAPTMDDAVENLHKSARKAKVESEKKAAPPEIEVITPKAKSIEAPPALEETQRTEVRGIDDSVAPVFEKTAPAVEKEAKGFFGKIAQAITTKKISSDEFENLFWELEVVLLENNIAVEVIEKIKDDLKRTLVDAPIGRGKVEKTIMDSLRASLEDVLSIESMDMVAKAKGKKPFVIAFVGVNGSGKTTTIAKVANIFLQNKMSVVLAAGDTFRAAAIDQLDMHAKKLGVKIVKHDYGADPAAVAFDAVKHAEAKGIDVVLVDTAGRLHSNINLVDEMKKIIRVAKPDMKIFVGESITGNDCVEQAKQFDEAIGIDGIILTKADVDEKGGAAISVSYVTKKPILYLGMGQEYADLVPFDGKQVLNSIGLV